MTQNNPTPVAPPRHGQSEFNIVGAASKEDFKTTQKTRKSYLQSTGRQVLETVTKYGLVKSIGDKASFDSSSLSFAELWDCVREANRPVEERSRCLAELIVRRDGHVAAYIADSLPNAAEPWRNELIFAAEHAEFFGNELRERIAQSLLDRANEMRPAVNPNSREALWSALRRYASLVSQDRADELRQFLTHEDDVVTRQVALRGIKTVFMEYPPTVEQQNNSVRELRTRVLELVKKYLDADLLTPGENSAVAMAAFDAAAVLCPEEIPPLSIRLKEIGKSRLIRRAQMSLKEIAISWSNSRVDERIVAKLRESLKVLNSDC